MNGYSFKDLAREVLSGAAAPLTAEEIWQEALNGHIAEKVGSKGKTPARSIQAQLYMDIKQDTNSTFIQTGKHPVRFALQSSPLPRCDEPGTSTPKSSVAETDSAKKAKWNERDLHPLLATYVLSDPHFCCRTRTIFQEQSTKGSKNSDKWTHPDIVGVRFPFDDYELCTIDLQTTLRINPYRIFSFELKKNLSTTHLREYFFQAVSNSSWANEGYLVAPTISDDTDFRDDLQRLSNAFGIGVIRLNMAYPDQSEIILQAREREALDWATVDRLAGINPNFRDFMLDIVKDAKVQDIRGHYDKTLADHALEQYLAQLGLSDEQLP